MILPTMCIGLLPALPAQEPARAPAPAAASELEPAVPDQGLSLGLDLLTEGPRRCDTFESLADVILDLRLRTVGEGVQRIVMNGGDERPLALPRLFEIELSADDGSPMALPTFRLGISHAPDDDRGSLFMYSYTHVEELGPEEVAMRRASLADWAGWSGIDLALGTYRMRAVYRGAPPEPAANQWVLPQFRHLSSGTWRGAARSQELRFRITGGEAPLDWSEPKRGLRVAVVARPAGRRFLGDVVRLRFLLENVSEETLQFVRDLPSSQEDEISIVHPTLGEQVQGRAIGTGSSPVVTWNLPPRARVWIDAAPIRTADEGFPTPGTYAIRHRLCLRDGLGRRSEQQAAKDAELAALHARMWDDSLETKPFPLELLARE